MKNATAQFDPKHEALRQHGTLNPRPENVTDPLFQDQGFFDARDLVQVKYEMLRRVRVEGAPVQATATAFGFSRMALYQIGQRFKAEGLAGLLPQPRGPRQGHKLTDEVVAFLWQVREAESSLGPLDLQQRLVERFGITVHPRSIQRALTRQRKKR
ncbi:MAG TPA: helix-turn-helix domain-containing protein [Anaerolineales bacterium]